ncbi:MAG: formylglycine-generating enzyme family protein, partial [Planctomycetia bacterium]|nr:formylglycine-generating enzyme family protein [Planctomycetia bacterium]
MKFISIPAGSFTMGSPETEKGHSDNENQVPVTITQAFELGKTVVTQKQWAEVMGTDPWNWENLKEIGNNYSAVYVSWLDATKFCKKLTALEHKSGKLSANQTYRLPTEAEWEYAYRAGTTTAFSCGD